MAEESLLFNFFYSKFTWSAQFPSKRGNRHGWPDLLICATEAHGCRGGSQTFIASWKQKANGVQSLELNVCVLWFVLAFSFVYQPPHTRCGSSTEALSQRLLQCYARYIRFKWLFTFQWCWHDIFPRIFQPFFFFFNLVWWVNCLTIWWQCWFL